jgi:hypothetical protein
MASKFMRRRTWWVKFHHPVTGARIRESLETHDPARAELLRRRIELEVALLRPSLPRRRHPSAAPGADRILESADAPIRGTVINQNGQLIVRADMERRGGIEHETGISAAMLAEVPAIDVNIGEGRRALEDQVKLLALSRGIDGRLAAIPPPGQGVVGGLRLKIMRDFHGGPCRLIEGIGTDVRRLRRILVTDKLSIGTVEQVRLARGGGVLRLSKGD